MLGFSDHQLRTDEVQIVVRCHTFFKLIQSKWIQKIKKNYKSFEITGDNEYNLVGGGDCSIFEIINAVGKAFSSLPDVRDAILVSLKPDLLLKKLENKDQIILELVILKIINKIARLGLNMKAIFEDWDKDKNN